MRPRSQPSTMNPKIEQVEQAMALIGNRWRPAIMYALIVQGTQRFSQLRRLIPGVSQRMLTKQLRDLERAGLVHRAFFENIPPRVEYSATPLGYSLRDLYGTVCQWADLHWAEVQGYQQNYDHRLGAGSPIASDPENDL